MLRSFLVLSLSFCALLTAGGAAHAASVAKVKGGSILIRSEGDTLRVGDMYYALSGGKKKAIIKIAKIKGDKALGVLVKGKADAGMTLIPRSGGGAVQSAKHGSSSVEGHRAYWGGLFGFAMDTMNVAVTNSITNAPLSTAALSGTGFSAKALFDYEVFKQIWFRGTFGVEQFNASGNSICGTGNTFTCDAKLTYATLDFMGRYSFLTGAYRPWLGLGIGLLFPATKSSTALNQGSIGTTNVIMIAGGLDWFITDRMYIPVSVEYGLLPKSDQVDAHWIELRAGLAIPF